MGQSERVAVRAVNVVKSHGKSGGQMFNAGNENEIMTACKVLFGPDVAVTREFLDILYPGGVKAAFRSRARETHPDMHAAIPDRYLHPLPTFHEVTAAYGQLARYCQQRTLRQQQRTRPSSTNTNTNDSASRPRTGNGSGTHSHGGVFHAGAVPQRKLLLGRYLYFRKIIPYHLLLASLAWQRQQRPTIGQLARNWGWLQTDEVLQVLKSATVSGRFGEKAQQLELLTARQVKMLLNCQRQRQRRLGDYFVEHGYLSRRRLERLLAEFNEHNAVVSPP